MVGRQSTLEMISDTAKRSEPREENRRPQNKNRRFARKRVDDMRKRIGTSLRKCRGGRVAA